MNIMAGSLGGHIPPIRIDGASVVSVCLNAVCPLQCRHCYLAPEEPAVGIAARRWLQFLESVFSDLKPHSLCFSGKEIFAVDESASLFFEAIRLRNHLQTNAAARTRIGVVTNGTLLGRYRRHLLQCPPDWLDVSIDGLERYHDEVRGNGAFRKMARNLPWLNESLGDRLWVALTLMEGNVEALPEIVSGLHGEFGLKQFSVGIYKPLTYTDSALRLRSPDRESRILRALLALGNIDPATGLAVRFEFDAGDGLLRARLEAERLVPTNGLLRVAAKQFDNGVTLQLSTITVPVGLWRAVRVTNEGFVVAAEDLVDATAYRQRAIGNIADVAYDARKMYAAGLIHPRFQELFGVSAEMFLAELARSA